MGILGRHKPGKTGTTGSFKSPITAAVERAQASLHDTEAKIQQAQAAFRELAIAALDDPIEGGQKALAARAELRRLEEQREVAEAALQEAKRREQERLTAKSQEELAGQRRAVAQHLSRAVDAAQRMQSMIAEAQRAYSDACLALQRASAVLDMETKREIGELLTDDNLRSLALVELQRAGTTPGMASAIVPLHTLTRWREFEDHETATVPSLVAIFEAAAENIKETYRLNQEGAQVTRNLVQTSPVAPVPTYTPAPHDPLHPSGEVIDLRGGLAAAPAETPQEAPTAREADPAPTVAVDPEQAIPAPAPADLLPEFSRRRLTAAEENRLLAEASI
jgi:hypothetical protein